MAEAAFWGLVAGSSLMLGTLLTFAVALPRRVVGLVMAFGAGVLLSAVAYELVLEAYRESHGEPVALGLFAGALVFFAGDWWIGRRAGTSPARGADEAAESPLSLVLGTLLDGIPEAFILGLGVATGGGVSVAYLASVFLANLPESISASSGLQRGGWSRGKLLGLWAGITIVTGLSAALGYLYFSNVSGRSGALVLAFAGGAVLTMLANSMLPEAYEEGGKPVGLLVVAGFALAILLTTLE